MQYPIVLLCLVLAPMASLAASQVAEGTHEHEKVMDHTPAFQEAFGYGLALDGEWALVTEGNFSATPLTGTIFAYRRNEHGWSLQQEITAPVAANWHWNVLFGNFLHLDGDRAYASNSTAYDSEGSVFALELVQGTWKITQEIRSPRPDRWESFATLSMAVSGDTMIVGAPTDDNRPPIPTAGVVYFYERVNGVWQFQQAMHGDDPGVPRPSSLRDPVLLGHTAPVPFYRWSRVGTQVQIHGDVAVASYQVWTNQEYPSSSMKAFVFERINGTWQQTAILKDPASASANQFGKYAIAIDDRQIVIGDGHSRNTCTRPLDPGEVFVFQRTGPGPGNWEFLQRFEGSNASTHSWQQGCRASDGFGESMSLHDDRLLVGASRGKRRLASNNTFGEAYLFERGPNGFWTEIEHYRHSDWDHFHGSSNVHGFGRAVALSDDYAMVGHPLAWGAGDTHAAGALYVFEQPHGVPYCGAPSNSTGEMATLSATGNLDPTAGILTLWADGLPAGRAGLLLASPSQGYTPNPGGSLGDLCLGSPLARIAVQVADPDGRARFAAVPMAIPINPATAIQSGETWHFQAWYRDTWAGTTSNFTEAISVSFP